MRLTLDKQYQKIEGLLPDFTDIYASQEGEDVLVRRLIKDFYYRPGFYVDVGAHHPLRFSTTAHYYMRGWNGINIEPNDEVIPLFNEVRPRDITLCVAVSEKEGNGTYYKFEESAFNTLDSDSIEYALSKTKLVAEVKVRIEPLNAILSEHMNRKDIERFVLLNIDVEGGEMAVLNSNDWQKYRPLLTLVEALTENTQKDIADFMNSVNYFFVARTKNTYIFAESNFKKCYVD